MEQVVVDYLKYLGLIFLFLSSLLYCTRFEQTEQISAPEAVRNLDNLKSYTTDIVPKDTVLLIQETVFESTEAVFIEGPLREVAVDYRNRLYIASTIPGKVGVYIFAPDGTFIKKLSRYGRGPGEFEAISSIAVSNETLYILDTRLQKIGFFSIDSLSHIKDELLKKDRIKQESVFISLMKGIELFSTGEDSVFIHTSYSNLADLNKNAFTRLYMVDFEGYISPQFLLELDRYKFYLLEELPNSNYRFGFTPAFSRNSLISVSEDGYIYTNWTENFLIKKFDSKGRYLSAFYYPWRNRQLDLKELPITKERLKIVKEASAPKTWPSIHDMIVDDEERLWVATITDSDSTYKWWVLQEDGELIARFVFPGERSEKSPFSKPSFTLVKNGYFYNREYNHEQGIDRIVKYRIVFKER